MTFRLLFFATSAFVARHILEYIKWCKVYYWMVGPETFKVVLVLIKSDKDRDCVVSILMRDRYSIGDVYELEGPVRALRFISLITGKPIAEMSFR